MQNTSPTFKGTKLYFETHTVNSETKTNVTMKNMCHCGSS